jgi:hypothetical protein
VDATDNSDADAVSVPWTGGNILVESGDWEGRRSAAGLDSPSPSPPLPSAGIECQADSESFPSPTGSSAAPAAPPLSPAALSLQSFSASVAAPLISRLAPPRWRSRSRQWWIASRRKGCC